MPFLVSKLRTSLDKQFLLFECFEVSTGDIGTPCSHLVKIHKEDHQSNTSKRNHTRVHTFDDADWLAGVDYEDEDEDDREENADEVEEYKDSEEQDIELEEAENIDPGEINDIIEDEANPNEHQECR